MPPKVRITREDIVRTAVEIVRQQGAELLNARTVAAALNCSTQPVFSNFASMDELRLAVADAAEGVYRDFASQETASGRYPPYKASGMAYIRFAKEEKNLFRLLFMRNRTEEIVPDTTTLGDEMETMVQGNTGLDHNAARLFHLEMWAFVHGLAVMAATGYLELETELISRMVTDAYQGLKLRFERE